MGSLVAVRIGCGHLGFLCWWLCVIIAVIKCLLLSLKLYWGFAFALGLSLLSLPILTLAFAILAFAFGVFALAFAIAFALTSHIYLQGAPSIVCAIKSQGLVNSFLIFVGDESYASRSALIVHRHSQRLYLATFFEVFPEGSLLNAERQASHKDLKLIAAFAFSLIAFGLALPSSFIGKFIFSISPHSEKSFRRVSSVQLNGIPPTKTVRFAASLPASADAASEDPSELSLAFSSFLTAGSV